MKTLRIFMLNFPVFVGGILQPLLEPDLWFPMDIVKDGLLKGREYDGTLSGNPDIVTGVFGNAIGFNRLPHVNQYVNFGNLRSTCFGDPELCTDGFTLSIWLKLFTQRSNEVYFIGAGGETRNSYGTTMYFKSGVLSFDVRTLSGKIWHLSAPFSATPFDTWIHVVGIWHPISSAKLYVNGQLTSSTVASSIGASTTYNDFVLAPNSQLWNTDKYGSSVMDDLRFWHRTLDDTDILELRQEGQTNLKLSTYPVLDEDNSVLTDSNKSTCLSVETGRSNLSSSLVEVSLLRFSGVTVLTTVILRLMGGYRQDYVEVFIGQSSLGCLSLYSCEYYTAAWEGPVLSTFHNCSCPSGICTHLFLGVNAAGKQCDIDWSYCQPIVLCQMEVL